MGIEGPHRIDAARIAADAAEVVGSVAIATGFVALLDQVAPATGLGVLYLLAVLFIAIRRGQLAAIATSILSVLALNFFFIEPRYRLTISDDHNLVALVVFLIAALVVGRLAAMARRQASEAERRALLASAREREAMIVAQAASSMLTGESVETQLQRIGDGGEGPRPVRATLSAARRPPRAKLPFASPPRARVGSTGGRTRAGIARASSGSRRHWPGSSTSPASASDWPSGRPPRRRRGARMPPRPRSYKRSHTICARPSPRSPPPRADCGNPIWPARTATPFSAPSTPNPSASHGWSRISSTCPGSRRAR